MLVIVNPVASRAEIASDELSRWFSANATTIIVRATSIDDLKQALLTHGANADRIVIGGGDGTISAALAELLQLNKPLAVLPLGTANDFARTLGVPADAIEAAEIAVGGCEHRIDVGKVNGRPFINVASIGLAAKVTELSHQSLASGVGGASVLFRDRSRWCVGMVRRRLPGKCRQWALSWRRADRVG
jgi:diacylglycerol kinase family enzyme